MGTTEQPLHYGLTDVCGIRERVKVLERVRDRAPVDTLCHSVLPLVVSCDGKDNNYLIKRKKLSDRDESCFIVMEHDYFFGRPALNTIPASFAHVFNVRLAIFVTNGW